MLYWFGRPKPHGFAVSLAIGLSILTLIISGMEPVIRASQRITERYKLETGAAYRAVRTGTVWPTPWKHSPGLPGVGLSDLAARIRPPVMIYR